MRALALIITIAGLFIPLDLHAQRPAPVGVRALRVATGTSTGEFVPRASAYPSRNRGARVLKHAAIGAAIGAGMGALAGIYEGLNRPACTTICVARNTPLRYAAVGLGIGALLGGISGLDTGR